MRTDDIAAGATLAAANLIGLLLVVWLLAIT